MIFAIKTTALFMAFCLITLQSTGTEAQTTITFDDSGLIEAELVTNQFKGVTFEGAILALQGFPRVAYGVANGLFADTTNDSPFNGPFLTDEIVDGDGTVSGTIKISFEEPVNQVSFWVSDLAENNEILSVTGFDENENILGTVSVNAGSPGTGDGIATEVIAPWNAVSRLEIRVDNDFSTSGWGLDTLTYTRDAGGLLGDINQDGSVDLLDVAPFVELLTNGQFQAEADINQDGVVDLLDVTPFVELLTGN